MQRTTKPDQQDYIEEEIIAQGYVPPALPLNAENKNEIIRLVRNSSLLDTASIYNISVSNLMDYLGTAVCKQLLNEKNKEIDSLLQTKNRQKTHDTKVQLFAKRASSCEVKTKGNTPSIARRPT